MNRIMAIGHDVVDVGAFGDQLRQPGSRLSELFSARERRQACSLASVKNDGQALHLAVRWAGKESVLKAWCAALGHRPVPYGIDDFPWPQVEIIDDSLGRPGVYLTKELNDLLLSSLGICGDVHWLISLSHDGSVASAVVLLGLDDPGFSDS
ncbi:4'-phosphopantetheinyl transferase family protein [Bifidobacterium bombi DSM 19703]|uniref:4'-phosphopantetheinyl transferase family protein n=2 Tax=Bifidobacterium bombi TaxID=471511 RepID=A0A080N613_9BIFI|nr:4'-phosphopantetheinyl transferase family protein [Bifidobacterium bombi DSM 19703]